MRLLRFLPLLGLFVVGCSTPLKTANALSATATEVRKATIPVANAECTAALQKCKVEGVPKMTDCAPYVSCSMRRDSIYAAERTVHRAALAVRWLKPKQELSKGSIMARLVLQAQKGLADLVVIAKQAGWYK